ncbi:hypothetical protein B0H13DRAFT_2328413 [Mycena leptocephala]|nr:hypothetical protein B0H13DRAFT_2328413 [Mycena leptocephala]
MDLTLIHESCTSLERRLEALGNGQEAIEEDSQEHCHDFLGLLSEACDLLRVADAADLDWDTDASDSDICPPLHILTSIRHWKGRIERNWFFVRLFTFHSTVSVKYIAHRMKEVLAAVAEIYAKRHPDGSAACIALPSVGGYKNRTPMLSYYLLDIPAEDSGQDFPLDPRHAGVGIIEIAHSVAIDDERKLIFVADEARIKSYAWGPLAILSAGRVLRAGKGLANLWKIDQLETHGADGKTRIGKSFCTEDAIRDDDAIQDSAGSSPSFVVRFADSDLASATWKTHPSLGDGNMLCGTNPRKSGDYSCISLDLAHGGKTVTRYLGNI